MNKGVNTIILEEKTKLTNAINDLLKEGIPPIVVSMMIEGFYREINELVNKSIEQEKQQAQEQAEAEKNQILYEEESEKESNNETEYNDEN